MKTNGHSPNGGQVRLEKGNMRTLAGIRYQRPSRVSIEIETLTPRRLTATIFKFLNSQEKKCKLKLELKWIGWSDTQLHSFSSFFPHARAA